MKRTGKGPWGNNPEATRSKDDPRTRGWSVQEFARLTWGDLRKDNGRFDTGDPVIDLLVKRNHDFFIMDYDREPNPDEPVFYTAGEEPHFMSVEAIQEQMGDEMEGADAPGHLIHAWKKTGLLLNKYNYRIHTPEQIREWEKAIEEYSEHRRQLMHFDDGKGWFVDNRNITSWKIIWYPELEMRAGAYHILLSKLNASAKRIRQFRRLGLEFEYKPSDDSPDYFEFWTDDPGVAARVADKLKLVWHRDTDNPNDTDFAEENTGVALMETTGEARLRLSFAVPMEDEDDDPGDVVDEHTEAVRELAKEYGWNAPCGGVVVRGDDGPLSAYSLIWIAMPEMPESEQLQEFRAKVEATVPALKMFEVDVLNPLDF